jgi:hypothetical protein
MEENLKRLNKFIGETISCREADKLIDEGREMELFQKDKGFAGMMKCVLTVN